MISLQGLMARELKAQGLLPAKYNDLALDPVYRFTSDSYLLNDLSVVSLLQENQPSGWKGYYVPVRGFPNEPDAGDIPCFLGCYLYSATYKNSECKGIFTRYQAVDPSWDILFKTPIPVILTAYEPAYWWDPGCQHRTAISWKLYGYRSESDLTAKANGVLLDTNGWDSPQAFGTTKRINISNSQYFQYYRFELLDRADDSVLEANKKWIDMGYTKLYARVPEFTCINNYSSSLPWTDAYNSSVGWKIYPQTEGNHQQETTNAEFHNLVDWHIADAGCFSSMPQASFHRWQYVQGSPSIDCNVWSTFKTPKKGVLSMYEPICWWEHCDLNNRTDLLHRLVVEWQLYAFMNEEDCRNHTNGILLDHGKWDPPYIAMHRKKIFLANKLSTQYYGIKLLKRHSIPDSDCYVDMGHCYFYMTDIEE